MNTKIQVGEVLLNKVAAFKMYPNKTGKYLLPYLKEYGEEFTKRFNTVYKVAAGIGDVIKSNRGIIHEKHVFIMINTKIAPNHFLDFLAWLKEEPMYEDDYIYGDAQNTDYHIVVIKFPEKHYGIFDLFLQGRYSEFANLSDVKQYFNNHPDILNVIVKDHNYRIKFTKRLNRMFDSSINPNEYDGELDLPPKQDLEQFNSHLKQ